MFYSERKLHFFLIENKHMKFLFQFHKAKQCFLCLVFFLCLVQLEVEYFLEF